MRLKGNKIMHFVPDFTVIDLETTGRSTQHTQITELSGVKYRNYKPVASYTTLIKPSDPILPFVVSLTGIDDTMVNNSPRIHEVINEFVGFIGDDLVVGHNVHFDYNLVYDAYYSTFKRVFSNNYSDTLYFSRILNKEVSSHKLENLCVYYDIERDIAHRGLPDCEQTGELYIKMKKKAQRNELLFVEG
jgi:DNA polymerase III subunit epsilon